MSTTFMAEQYDAFRVMLRVSDMRLDMKQTVRDIAAKAEKVFQTDGSNATFGEGYWKGDIEIGATIEIVFRCDNRDDPIFNWDYLNRQNLMEISEYVNKEHGLSCFATVEPTTAYELYELAE